MNTRFLKSSGLAFVIVALLLGCPMPTVPGPGGSGGSLTIQVGNHINSQTLLPPISMAATSYTVSGTGPGGATFSRTTSGGSVTVSSLAFGSWNITVDAVNAEGTLIGRGNSSATVHTGQTTTVAISVVPLTGNGTLNLTVSWTASQVETPSIVASLSPPVGDATTLSFSIDGNQGTYSSTTIPAGYQTLTVQLMDNGIAVMGAVEVVRVVAGQTTSGTYAFTNVNQPGGTVVVNISPELADPIPVSISGVPATVSARTSITATASVSDGTTGAVYVWYLNGVSVGTGASLTFGSALAAGYYRLDVTAYTATRAGSATANLQVTAASGSAGRFAYVSNSADGTVSAYSIGPGGLLAPLDAPLAAAGMSPYKIVATPNGSFLYVTNGNTNSSSVTAFSIASAGALTALNPPQFSTASTAFGAAITPNGQYLYVANSTNGTVSAYSIGPGGLLSALGTPTFAVGGFPFEIEITPNGSFLYVTDISGGTVSGFSVGTDGVLTPLSRPNFPAGASPAGIAVTPNGAFLYVTNLGSNTISAFAIGVDGLLALMSTPIATGGSPYDVAVTPNGSWLYVSNASDNSLSAFSIGTSGLLGPLSTPTFAAGGMPYGIAISLNSSYLYVTNVTSNSVSGYSIDSSGLLTPLSISNFATGGTAYGIAIVQ